MAPIRLRSVDGNNLAIRFLLKGISSGASNRSICRTVSDVDTFSPLYENAGTDSKEVRKQAVGAICRGSLKPGATVGLSPANEVCAVIPPTKSRRRFRERGVRSCEFIAVSAPDSFPSSIRGVQPKNE